MRSHLSHHLNILFLSNELNPFSRNAFGRCLVSYWRNKAMPLLFWTICSTQVCKLVPLSVPVCDVWTGHISGMVFSVSALSNYWVSLSTYYTCPELKKNLYNKTRVSNQLKRPAEESDNEAQNLTLMMLFGCPEDSPTKTPCRALSELKCAWREKGNCRCWISETWTQKIQREAWEKKSLPLFSHDGCLAILRCSMLPWKLMWGYSES